MEISKNQNELYHLTICGKPQVKKNCQRTIYQKYLKRNIVIYSTAYSGWKKDFLLQLGLSRNGRFRRVAKSKTEPTVFREKINFPVILKCHFYLPDKRRRDLSNLYEGVQDILVEAGILEDDCSEIVVGHDGSRVFLDKENPRLEFWILKAGEEAPI